MPQGMWPLRFAAQLPWCFSIGTCYTCDRHSLSLTHSPDMAHWANKAGTKGRCQQQPPPVQRKFTAAASTRKLLWVWLVMLQ